MEKENNKNHFMPWIISIVSLLVFVGSIFMSYYMSDILSAKGILNEKKAAFGESFGAVNALVSALAFAGLIVSVFMQHSELKLQREEVSKTGGKMAQQQETLKTICGNLQSQYEEMKSQRETMAQQQKTLSMINENLQLQGKEMTQQQETLSRVRDNLQLQYEEMKLQKETMAQQQETLSMINDNLQLQYKEMKSQKEKMVQQQETLSMINENLQLQGKEMTQQQETLSKVSDNLQLQYEEMKSQKETMIQQQETLSMVNDNLTRLSYGYGYQIDNMKELNTLFGIQNRNIEIQRFENTLFNMFALLRTIVGDLKISEGSDVKSAGIDTFEYSYKRVNTDGNNSPFSFTFGAAAFASFAIGNIVIGTALAIGLIISWLAGGSDDKKIELENCPINKLFNNYFNLLYSILIFIDANPTLTDEEKKYYVSILKSQLSTYEIIWSFYYGISIYCKDNMKQLIEKYSLLSDIRKDLIVLSPENKKKIDEKHINIDEWNKKHIAVSDYEFCVTDDKTEANMLGKYGKYYLSAFYGENDIEKGMKSLKEWNDLFNGNTRT